MALSPSTTCDFHSSPISTSNASDVSDNNLQHFFVLHKAPARKCERKSSSTYRRTKRKIDMLLSSPIKDTQEENDAIYEQLRLEAFENTWSKINSTVKEVLREINLTLFEEIRQWVFESFSTIRSASPVHMMKPYPIAAGATCKRIPAALIFTKNIEFVDDMLMFQDLKGYMQSNGCHAAFLSALDISTKCGIGSCLRSLYKQLVPEASDVVDVPLIASWYCKDENYDKPIAVIIEDMERCDSAVLADFIKMLSEWVMKIPIIFILGVTTFDALRKLLPSSVMHNLQLCKFTLESPIRRMYSLIEYVLVRPSSGFFIGHKVALFLRNHFLRHDGTITSFLKALKLACVKHFSGEPLSFLCPGMLHDDCEAFWSGKCESLSEVLRSYAFDLPSCQRGKTTGDNNLAQGLSKLKWLQNSWSSVVLCLLEVGKLSKIQLLDIFCEAIDPTLCSEWALGQQLLPPLTASHDSVNGGFISQAIQKVRELPSDSLCQLFGQWSLHTAEVIEMDKEVKAVLSMINLPSDGHTSKEKQTVNIHGCLASSARKKGKPSLNDEAAMLLVSLLRKFLVPIESVPFHEIFCFKDVSSLKSALIGDPRSVIQDDLLKSDEYLQSTSCSRRENVLSSSIHDTAIMYSLAQEYGDLINLHDWYHSFKTKVLISNPKAKRKAQHSPASKKGKSKALENEVSIQARFCKAVTELQITGLVRMPSKRRPDFLQRIAFDL
ncbi:origin of replication complex subunit 3 [Dendrobium catenatum]|uniref:origin of replication complex subunit 3 n=1 Tax=Dendrobium catenatum TaxID=906689 RepID=UPI0009F2A93A|nr:origin of replication complex subunit 3 [Dendrobium catenatum]XP_028552481.1 origin of replication complex subunit 3 [Dendrobium catenatum]